MQSLISHTLQQRMNAWRIICCTNVCLAHLQRRPRAHTTARWVAFTNHLRFVASFRFPMPKDHLLYLELQRLGLASHTFTPTYPDAETLCLAHERSYVDSFLDGSISAQQMKRIGLPWSQALVQRTLIGECIACCRQRSQNGSATSPHGPSCN